MLPAFSLRVPLLFASPRLLSARVCASHPLEQTKYCLWPVLVALCIAYSFPAFADTLLTGSLGSCLLVLQPVAFRHAMQSAAPVAFSWLVHSLSMASFLSPQRQIHLLLHETHQTSHLVWMLSVSLFISRWPIFLPLIFPEALSVWLLALIFYSKLQPVGTCIENFPVLFSCIHVILYTVVAPTFPPQFKAHFCLVSRQSSTPSRLPCPPHLCHPLIVSVICPMSPMTATLGSVGLHHYFLHFSHSSLCPHFSNITSMSAHRSFRNILEASI